MPIYLPSQDSTVLNITRTGAQEISTIVATAEAGVKEITTLTIPATAGATQADYIIFENQAGLDWAVWLDIDANGTAPTGAAFVAVNAARRIEVDIVGAASSTDNATLAFAAIGSAFTDVSGVDNADGTLTFTQDLMGVTVDPVPHDEGDAGAGSILTNEDTAGVASNHLDNHFLLNSANDDRNYYCWFNVDGEGVDPAITGRSGLEATWNTPAADTVVATAIDAAVSASNDFAAVSPSATVTITNAINGQAVDIAAGDSGLSVAVSTQGIMGTVLPGDKVEDLTNTPTAIV